VEVRTYPAKARVALAKAEVYPLENRSGVKTGNVKFFELYSYYS